MSATILPLKQQERAVPPAPPPKFAQIASRIAAAFRAESDRAVLWLPVLLGLGVGSYFALPAEPPWIVVLTACGLVVAVAIALPSGLRARLFWPALAIAAGMLASAWRVESVGAPVLTRDLGMRQIEGTVRWFEPLEAPGRMRLVLERPVVEGLAAKDTPVRIRLRLTGAQREPAVGDRIRLVAALGPPPGEIAPGGYEFARVAWFERIGAVGFGGGNFTVIAAAAVAEQGLGRFFARTRATIHERIRKALPERTAAFGAALTMGARAAIAHEDLLALQNSGLLHILSISGLHLALVAGLAMVVLRGGMALVEPFALAWPLKKIAALLALLISGFYVGLSGGDVATIRSFLMIAVAIGAILIDRPALTLRSIAFAAIVLLLVTPESLFHPSFQMSFGAVTALVSGYEWARARRASRPVEAPRWPRPARFILGIAATTLLAELATAPFAAYHFNQFVLGGLLANEIAIPLLGFYIMPLAVLAVLAMPFGLEAVPLRLMGWGLDQLLSVAHWVAKLPHSVTYLESWPAYALVLMVLGGLWLALWRTRLRWWGAPIAAVGLGLALAAPGSDLLADEEGDIAFRVKTADGWRYGLVGVRPHSFKGEAWVRRLGGDPAWGADSGGLINCDALGCLVPVGRGASFSLVRDGRGLAEECASARALITLTAAPPDCTSPKLVLDRWRLVREGPVAVRFVRGEPRLEAVGLGPGWPWRRPAPTRPARPTLDEQLPQDPPDPEDDQ
jgi:competence protein ComEC